MVMDCKTLHSCSFPPNWHTVLITIKPQKDIFVSIENIILKMYTERQSIGIDKTF